ncbi:MAG: sodium/proton-translocating pyrophosphatase, partial [Bdellovibrionales bacterium]|nr:sodium/proton-translocating pyrophosphatase [Bdellovibrionales bacterium]
MLEYSMPIVGAVGIAFAYKTYSELEALPAGSERMQEIARDIREVALAFLKKEAGYLCVFIASVFLILWLTMEFPIAISYVVG